MVAPAAPLPPDPTTRDFYVDAMQILDREGIDYVVGGGYALAYFSGIARNTKDLDLFVRPADSKRTLDVLAAAGYRTEYFYPFWIAKALSGDAFIDILYNSGNGVCVVDDDWFTHAHEAEVLGYRTRLAPPEEQLWSKAFVMDRDRFDGADINHLIHARGHEFDWERLLRRFQGHERVLSAHLTLYGYVYPSDRDQVPTWVLQRLTESIAKEPTPQDRICRGGFIAQRGYGTVLREWEYIDARLKPLGPLTEEEIAQLPSE